MATLIFNDVISLTSIDGTDCLGDSRAVINNNTINIGQALSGINTNTTTISSTLIDTNNNVTVNQTNTLTVSTDLISLSASVTELQTSFNINNTGPLDTLGTLVSSLSVFDASSNYIGYIPIYQ
jgi:methyl-accepting chemotaxis protein